MGSIPVRVTTKTGALWCSCFFVLMRFAQIEPTRATPKFAIPSYASQIEQIAVCADMGAKHCSAVSYGDLVWRSKFPYGSSAQNKSEPPRTHRVVRICFSLRFYLKLHIKTRDDAHLGIASFLAFITVCLLLSSEIVCRINHFRKYSYIFLGQNSNSCA